MYGARGPSATGHQGGRKGEGIFLGRTVHLRRLDHCHVVLFPDKAISSVIHAHGRLGKKPFLQACCGVSVARVDMADAFKG